MIYSNKPYLGAKNTDYRVYYTQSNTCVFRSPSLKEARKMAEFWHKYEVDHGNQQEITVRKYTWATAYIAGLALE